jgi:hypothetical protein
MDLEKDNGKLKDLSYRCVWDRSTKMSMRIGCAVLYTVLRLADVIDWWFPVKDAEDNKTS